ncbi:hypothetical protein BZZ01_17160 [Nostocales cyanobacterium HT-58-2]|nr:hypothetical protein BZZ01_17160 [Nostocales cyanobacterium HT-58-2]
MEILSPEKWILRGYSVLFLILFLGSCSSKKSPEELTKELDSVYSWAATAHMVSEAWIRNDVPTEYTEQTLEKTQKYIQEETDKLSKLSIPPKQQRTVLELLEQLKSTVGQMSIAVEHKDRSAISRRLDALRIATQLKELSTQEQLIHRLAKPTSEKP